MRDCVPAAVCPAAEEAVWPPGCWSDRGSGPATGTAGTQEGVWHSADEQTPLPAVPGSPLQPLPVPLPGGDRSW